MGSFFSNGKSLRLSVGVLALAFLPFTQAFAATTEGGSAVPSGTVLPVVLSKSVNLDKCKPGQTLRGEIAQEIHTANGITIPAGTQIEGHVVEASPKGNHAGSDVSIQFDKLNLSGQWTPVVTHLKAIADDPHALFVYGADASGVFGIDHLTIRHSGNTNPAGTTVLESKTRKLKLYSGDGLYLQVV